MKRFVLILTVLLAMGTFWVVAANGAELTVEEIIAKVDENLYYTSSYSEMEMEIRSGRRTMVKEMRSWAEGKNALVEFTNRADQGTKYLRLDDELWMFFPDAEDLVKISGHMLRQGFMGSDVSYEDMLEAEKLADVYRFTLVGEEEIDGRPTYVIEAQAPDGAEVTYAKRKIWVDQERFVSLREEMYAVSGRLLKTASTSRVEEISGRFFPMEFVMEDVLKKNSATVVRVKEIKFDVEIPEGTFSLQQLMR